jgi:hypothetical protein
MIQAMETKRTFKSAARKIDNFRRRYHLMPTFEEMPALLEARSRIVFNFRVNKLPDEDIPAKNLKDHLTFVKILIGLPLAGDVPAGLPSPAEEELRDAVSGGAQPSSKNITHKRCHYDRKTNLQHSGLAAGDCPY